ncbi:unnamed protein product [Prorocentrum cordatum]|uniref:Uncharacterized protein n=1 Tax=Prorocentrum cordatum TaxID=2364126 RepID=A0ABN9X2K0_9DINO|nr:unnamed protein product [Polarella glacialis]
MPFPYDAQDTQPIQSQRSMQDKAPADHLRTPPRRIRVGGQWLPKPPPPVRKKIPWRQVESPTPAADKKKGAKVLKKMKEKKTKKKKKKLKDQSVRTPFANLKGQIDGSHEWKLKDAKIEKWNCEDCAKRLNKRVVLFGFRVQCPSCFRPPPSPTREKQMAAIRKANREEFERSKPPKKQLVSATAASSRTCPKVTARKNSFLKKFKLKRKFQGKQATVMEPSEPTEQELLNVADKGSQLEHIDAIASKQQTTKENLQELIQSLQPALHTGTEEARHMVKALIQQAEKSLSSAEESLVRLRRLRTLAEVGGDLEFSLEDFLEGRRLQDALDAASTPEAMRMALPGIKSFVFRLSLAQAPQ